MKTSQTLTRIPLLFCITSLTIFTSRTGFVAANEPSPSNIPSLSRVTYKCVFSDHHAIISCVTTTDRYLCCHNPRANLFTCGDYCDSGGRVFQQRRDSVTNYPVILTEPTIWWNTTTYRPYSPTTQPVPGGVKEGALAAIITPIVIVVLVVVGVSISRCALAARSRNNTDVEIGRDIRSRDPYAYRYNGQDMNNDIGPPRLSAATTSAYPLTPSAPNLKYDEGAPPSYDEAVGQR